MPTFVYRAKHGPGKIVEGELFAESRAAALAALDGQGYTPIGIHEKTHETGRKRFRGAGRVGPRDVTVLTRQLGSLIRAGVPILRALGTVAEQTENGNLGRIVWQIQAAVRDGTMLSEALSRHPALFTELYVNMIRSGESAGVLDEILERLADAREREEDLRRRVQAALAYPVLIVSVGVGTIFMLLAFFLPRVVELFKDYRKLPLPTRALIALSDFTHENWYWILILIVLLLAMFKRLSSAERGRVLVDRMKLRLPLIGRFIRQSDIARFARTLGLLIESGIPIDRALALSAATMRNTVFREEIESVRRETVEQGHPLTSGLKRARYVPPFVANMVGVGEESGHLEQSLVEVAVFYEKEFEQLSRLATSLLEPILILVVGGLVGFIVAAMLLPIFQLGTAM